MALKITRYRVHRDYNSIKYLKNAMPHRENGPAFEQYDGFKSWWIYGFRHRDDGPAIIGNSRKEWWLHGIEFTQEEWFERLTLEQKEKAIWNMDNW